MRDVCDDPNCFNCMWLTEAVIRFNDGLKAAILAAAAHLPQITYRRWLPDTTTTPEETP